MGRSNLHSKMNELLQKSTEHPNPEPMEHSEQDIVSRQIGHISSVDKYSVQVFTVHSREWAIEV